MSDPQFEARYSPKKYELRAMKSSQPLTQQQAEDLSYINAWLSTDPEYQYRVRIQVCDQILDITISTDSVKRPAIHVTLYDTED